MEVEDYLKEVAYIGKSDIGNDEGKIYYSKFDDSYITRVGMEDNVKYLADREITQELTHGVGFSPKDGKWYGWSHRAIYGFEIGSTCKKGNAHYTANNPEEMIDDYANFFADISKECAEEHRAMCMVLPDRSGIRILHAPLKIPMVESISDLGDAIENPEDLPEVDLYKDDCGQVLKCGKGQWTAKTLDDAKQMAQDFQDYI